MFILCEWFTIRTTIKARCWGEYLVLRGRRQQEVGYSSIITVYRLLISPLKMWQSLNIWEWQLWIKTTFTEKLGAYYVWGMLATIQVRMSSCLPPKNIKIKTKSTQNCSVICWFIWLWNLVSPIMGQTEGIWEQSDEEDTWT